VINKIFCELPVDLVQKAMVLAIHALLEQNTQVVNLNDLAFCKPLQVLTYFLDLYCKKTDHDIDQILKLLIQQKKSNTAINFVIFLTTPFPDFSVSDWIINLIYQSSEQISTDILKCLISRLPEEDLNLSISMYTVLTDHNSSEVFYSVRLFQTYLDQLKNNLEIQLKKDIDSKYLSLPPVSTDLPSLTSQPSIDNPFNKIIHAIVTSPSCLKKEIQSIISHDDNLQLWYNFTENLFMEFEKNHNGKKLREKGGEVVGEEEEEKWLREVEEERWLRKVKEVREMIGER